MPRQHSSHRSLNSKRIGLNPSRRHAGSRVTQIAREATRSLIGVDEKRGILGAPPKDMASGWSQVRAAFDHVAPELIDVSVDWQGTTMHALAFLTDLAPYVTRDPQFRLYNTAECRRR